MNFQHADLSQTYVTLFVSLQLAEKEILLPAIIDLACSCFLDLALAQILLIPHLPKKQNLQVLLADGSLPCSGPVSQETGPILTITDSGHQEYLRFDIICSPMFPIILVLLWLQAHDP